MLPGCLVCQTCQGVSRGEQMTKEALLNPSTAGLKCRGCGDSGQLNFVLAQHATAADSDSAAAAAAAGGPASGGGGGGGSSGGSGGSGGSGRGTGNSGGRGKGKGKGTASGDAGGAPQLHVLPWIEAAVKTTAP